MESQEFSSQSSTSSLIYQVDVLNLFSSDEISLPGSYNSASVNHLEILAKGGTNFLEEIDPKVFNNPAGTNIPMTPIIEEGVYDDIDEIQPSWQQKDEITDQNILQNVCYNGEFFHETWYSGEEHIMDEDQYESTTSINSSVFNSSLSSAQSMNSSKIRDSKVTEGMISGLKINVDRSNFSSRYHDDTIFLMNYWNKDKTKHPKKEYIRAQLIRAHKKVLRQIENNRPLAKVVRNLDIKNQEISRITVEIKNHFYGHRDVLSEESKTESGPNTDGKCKRSTDAKHKSWNNKFVKDYFSKPAVQKAYLLFIELFFAEATPDTLCKRANMFCCKNIKHDAECDKAWAEMRNFFTETMLTNVGVVVNNPSEIDHFALREVEGVPSRPEGFENSDIGPFLNEQD